MGNPERPPKPTQIEGAKPSQMRDNLLPEHAPALTAEDGGGHVPITVFDQMAELQRRLDEAEARRQDEREKARERARRWRERNPERAREQTRTSMAALRARKRQGGS